MIEPEYYCPIIPLLLVNGCQGIGTGWSTYIPQHDPLDVLNYIRAKLDEKKRLPTIKPWVKDFKGDMTIDNSRGSYITEGIITPTSSSSPDAVHANREKRLKGGLDHDLSFEHRGSRGKAPKMCILIA